MANKKSKFYHHDWSELHQDLLIAIAKKLATIEDFIRFGVVCRPWRSATLDKHQFPMLAIPWLMLTENVDNDHRLFFSPIENKTRQIFLPEARGCQCWGSPFGWLVTYCIVNQDVQLHLLNPLSRTRIPLPSKADFIKYDTNPMLRMHKVVIVSMMESDYRNKMRYLVLAVIGYNRKLVFAYDGANTWSTVKYTHFPDDFICSNGTFYAVSYDGRLTHFDIGRQAPRVYYCAKPPYSYPQMGSLYLVELDRELCMVSRRWGCFSISPLTLKTDRMQVYKFNSNCRKWKQVETLGDYALFLGRNTSFALKASNYLGCQPDCIYFTDDEQNFSEIKLVDNDMGIFNMKSQTIKHLYEGQGIFRRSVWITPRLV